MLNIFILSPRVLRVEPDISVSIHGSDLVSYPHFQNPENISDGVYNHVLGTHGSATTSCMLYSHATRYWPISHAVPLQINFPCIAIEAT